METIPEQRKVMTNSIDTMIRERVQQIETMPAIPAVFLPLLKLLSHSEEVRVDEVARLVVLAQ